MGNHAQQHLEHLCWNSSIWFGQWPAVSANKRLQMCRDMTAMYLEFRRIPREEAEPWVWEAIDALHVELAALVAASLPANHHKALMLWMNGGISKEMSLARFVRQAVEEPPF